MDRSNNKISQFCILGASFNTANLGVSALAWSTSKLILDRWPLAKINFIGASRDLDTSKIYYEGDDIDIVSCPVRFSFQLFIKNHIVWLWLGIYLLRLFPYIKRLVKNDATTFGALARADLICDISGGDSFSDIYGPRRLLKGFLRKRMCQSTGKPYILLPQTYGPFNSITARILARSVIKNSTAIYSRDKEGLQQIKNLMGERIKTLPKLCPDVAFVLDAIRPNDSQTAQVESLRSGGQILVGINISGLLYNGGYNSDNMFGLKCDYKQLMRKTIEFFASYQKIRVLIIPHVKPTDGYFLENDLNAARNLAETLSVDTLKSVTILDGEYDQSGAKYLIGLCDFFLGARMHSTIAAISQCIPAVGMAYSKKFSGVFEMAGIEDCVVDMREKNELTSLESIQEIFKNRKEIKIRLKAMIPILKGDIDQIFAGM